MPDNTPHNTFYTGDWCLSGEDLDQLSKISCIIFDQDGRASVLIQRFKPAGCKHPNHIIPDEQMSTNPLGTPVQPVPEAHKPAYGGCPNCNTHGYFTAQPPA